MSLKKQYSKTRPTCTVIFRLAKELAQNAQKANLVGEFNNWDIESIIKKRDG